MNENRVVIIWDYWIERQSHMAYALGVIDGILYLSESSIQELTKGDDTERENGKLN